MSEDCRHLAKAAVVFWLVFICQGRQVGFDRDTFVNNCPLTFSETASHHTDQKPLLVRCSSTETSQTTWCWIEASLHAWARWALVLLYLCATLAWPTRSEAMDRTIAPPTCPSFPYKCKTRDGRSALERAEANRRAAKQALEITEQKASRILVPGDQRPGVLEVQAFWDAEVQRLAFNRQYLEQLRSQFFRNSGDATQAHLFSRLVLQVPNVTKEVQFWCEGLGMQPYGSLTDGGQLVAFGPPGIADYDEGAFFTLEIHPSSLNSNNTSKTLEGVSDFPSGPRLSFVQLALPNVLRPYKILEAGGELFDTQGYFEVKSPAGILVRAYIDDRRDPVELVALAAKQGKALELCMTELEQLGLKSQASYKMRSPVTQSEMPTLPSPNILYGNGDSALSTQLLLLPLVPEETINYFLSPQTLDELGLVPESPIEMLKGVFGLGKVEEQELPKPYSPISGAGHVDLIVYAPSRDAARREPPISATTEAVSVKVQAIEVLG